MNSTHNQALSALLFLYREVLGIELPWLNDINRPTSTRRIPCVLTKDEVPGLLAVMEGETALLARLLYDTGMRLMEGMRLRSKTTLTSKSSSCAQPRCQSDCQHPKAPHKPHYGYKPRSSRVCKIRLQATINVAVRRLTF